ncbi:MAG: glutathione S-transferase family protein [Polyangiaceae bacterium]|nr:glutathione S-transferase family protein [Polyangiaceae bacterium]
MIQLHAWGTPNGKKIPVALEEMGLRYTLHKVDIGKGQQKEPAFLALNPNGKIPAIVDDDTGIKVFESGAILVYLAEKTGKLLPREGQARADVLAWVMFQMAGVGPMMGQLGFFKRANNEAAIERFRIEVERLFGVMEGQLGKQDYLAGEYSIADIATFTWASNHAFVGLDVTPFPKVQAWLARVAERPAVKKGLAAFD